MPVLEKLLLKDLLSRAGFTIEDEEVSAELVVDLLKRSLNVYTIFHSNNDARATHKVAIKDGKVHVHSVMPRVTRHINDLVEYLITNPDGNYGFKLTYSGYGDDSEDEVYDVIYREVTNSEELRRQLYTRCLSIGLTASKIEILGDPGRHPKIDRVVWTYDYTLRAWIGETRYYSGKVIPIRI